MTPRKVSSKKWTPLPSELIDQIRGVVAEAFAEKLLPSTQFFVEGRIYKEELCLRIGFLEKGRLVQCNFEASLDLDPQTQQPLERIHVCVDATASMMLEFIESQQTAEYPFTWQSVKFNQQEIFLQYSTLNSDLERAADKLLGVQESEALVYEEAPEENEANESSVYSCNTSDKVHSH